MRVQGRYFEVTDRFTPGQGRRTTTRQGSRAQPRPEPEQGKSEEPRLVISVPKRLLRLAVRRNTVKRIARESWRHAAATDRARLRPPAILVRLIRAPLGELPSAATPDPALTPASSGSAAPGRPKRRAGRAVAPVAPPLPLATFKRLLRADLDAIWAGQFRPASGRSGRPGRSVRSNSAVPSALPSIAPSS